MTRTRPQNVAEVAERQLCMGCGACAYMQPEEVSMVDDLDLGRRPRVAERDGRRAPTTEAVAACPGLELERRVGDWDDGWSEALADAWGPVLAIWEGHAGDPEIRAGASSGGAATALALHCMTGEGMAGTLHVTARDDVPYLNRTVLSTSRDELVAAMGSRYAPASPCDSLELVERAARPCVLIGKPCDIAGAQRARRLRPGLDRKLGLTIAIFCAGTPSTRGTLEMIEAMGIDPPEAVRSVRYRGNGWPGEATVEAEVDGTTVTCAMTYEESWGEILQKHRTWRCYVCADHTGEFADVSVGDPWYRPVEAGEPGSSLVIARTHRGRQLVQRAIESGALQLSPADASILLASQPNLLMARGAAWGRLAGGRLAGMSAPRYRRMAAMKVWWRTHGTWAKLKSIASTPRRRLSGKLARRVRVGGR